MAADAARNQSAVGYGSVAPAEILLDLNETIGYSNVSCVWSNGSGWTGDNTNDSFWCGPQWELNNNSSSINSFIPSALFQAIIYSLYSVIFVLALVGNFVVCAVVFTSIRKWTVTNFFIVNMAAGDILMAFFCIPFTFVPTFVLLYWPFGAAMCRIVSFSQAVSVFVSAYTMVAISSDRYLAIVYPLRPRMTRKQAKWIIVAVWLAAFSTAMPMLLFSELILPDSYWHYSENRYICTEVWADRDQQTQYTTVLLLLQYCFPLAVLVFTYGRIGLEIWGKKTPGEAHQHRDLRLARSKRKMIKMMIIVVFFFAFCWLPFNLLQIIADQYQEIWSWSKINYVAFACHWLAMSHSAYNPIIYCCFNSKFRQGFQVLAVRCGCRCLTLANEVRWTGECECGGPMSGTQGSGPGDHGCAPLQRVNTYTTCTGVSNLAAHRNSTSSSCRALLSSHQQRSPLYRRNCNSFQPHQQPRDAVAHQRARCCSSCNGSTASMQRRFSPTPRGSHMPVNYNRSHRPHKFVFRANFSNPSLYQQQLVLQQQQQQQLLSGGVASPTSNSQSGGNETAESHI